MTSPFITRLTTAKEPVKAALPSPAALPVTIRQNANQKRYNPFLSATNTESAEFKDMYGVNRPLTKPMFLGYKDDQAIFGGSRLFILY